MVELRRLFSPLARDIKMRPVGRQQIHFSTSHWCFVPAQSSASAAAERGRKKRRGGLFCGSKVIGDITPLNHDSLGGCTVLFERHSLGHEPLDHFLDPESFGVQADLLASLLQSGTANTKRENMRTSRAKPTGVNDSKTDVKVSAWMPSRWAAEAP